jgi:hypothetical protein
MGGKSGNQARGKKGLYLYGCLKVGGVKGKNRS